MLDFITRLNIEFIDLESRYRATYRFRNSPEWDLMSTDEQNMYEAQATHMYAYLLALKHRVAFYAKETKSE